MPPNPMNYSWDVIEYINTTNITGLFQYANDVTGSLFMSAITFAIFIVAFTVFRKWSDKDALAASGFITAVLSMFMWAGGLIGAELVILFFLITGVGMFMQTRD